MDIKLNYRIYGQGRPIFLLHGNGESMAYFKEQIPFLSKSRTVIAVDTRGHGGSPRGEGEFSISRFADDLLWLFDELNIQKADILGFSDGGNIALTFALRYGERVNKLILNGANLFPSGVRLRYRISMELSYAAALLSKRTPAVEAKRELLALMVKEPHISPEELGKLDMPVLVIVGTRDVICTSHSKLIADGIRDSWFVQLNGTHFIAAEEPKDFNRVLGVFLDE